MNDFNVGDVFRKTVKSRTGSRVRLAVVTDGVGNGNPATTYFDVVVFTETIGTAPFRMKFNTKRRTLTGVEFSEFIEFHQLTKRASRSTTKKTQTWRDNECLI